MTSGFVYAVPASSGGGSLADGDYGDVTVSGGGTIIEIDADAVTTTEILDGAVTFPKIQDISGLTVMGNPTNLSTVPDEIQATGADEVLMVNSGGTTLEWAQVRAGGIATGAVTFEKIENVLTDSLLGRDTAGTGDVENIGLNATLSMTGGGALQREALTGDVTASAGSNATTIAAGVVSNSKLRDSFGLSVIGRSINSVGSPADITTGGADSVLRLNSAGTLLDFGTIATGGIANDAVTYAKLQNGTGRSVLGKAASGAGDNADIVASADNQVLGRFAGSVAFSAIDTSTLANASSHSHQETIHTERMTQRRPYGFHAAGTVTLAMTDPVALSSTTDPEQYVFGFGMADAVVTWLGFDFVVPAEAVGSSDIDATIAFAVIGAPGANTVDIDLVGTVYEDGNSIAAGTTFSSATVIDISGYGAGEVVVATLTALGVSVGPRAYIHGTLQRDARVANTDDDYADTIIPLWIQFNGTVYTLA